jgi:hypothetical protein
VQAREATPGSSYLRRARRARLGAAPALDDRSADAEALELEAALPELPHQLAA